MSGPIEIVLCGKLSLMNGGASLKPEIYDPF
jgi:hypothetical protein